MKIYPCGSQAKGNDDKDLASLLIVAKQYSPKSTNRKQLPNVVSKPSKQY